MFNQIQACLSFVASQGHRGLVHIQADSEQQALLHLNQLFAQEAAGVSPMLSMDAVLNHSALAGLTYLQSEKSNCVLDLFCSAPLLHINQARPYLGQTLKLFIYNTFQGLNPNILAMLSGAVQQGGVIILLTPTLNEWSQFNDPDYQKLSTEAPEFEVKPFRYFLDRGRSLIQKFILEYPGYMVSINSSSVCYRGKNIDRIKASKHHILKADNLNGHCNQTVDQAVIIKHLLGQYIAGHNVNNDKTDSALQATVLEGDRGRGKSACIGLYLRELLLGELNECQNTVLQENNAPVKSANLNTINGFPYIVITAVHRNALDAVYLHLGELSKYVKFKALDEIVQDVNCYDILLIDEAAAISGQVLLRCLGKARQTIFSTTTAGYEGNGRGFSIRFTQVLDAYFTFGNLNRFTLTQPIRYQANDPFEALINQWCLLDASHKILAAHQCTRFDKKKIEYHYINSAQLAANESLLVSVFGLLLEAHYQTSADDARFILDYPHLIILVACYGSLEDSHIVGACLCVHEGSFDAATISSFANKSRRLRGHIIPQQLANTSSVRWLAMPFIRVVRIAVLDAVRKNGVATELLSALSIQQPYALLGASFGETPELLSFWQANDFQLMQLGMKPESSTGSVAAVVLKKPLLAAPFKIELAALWKIQLAFCFKDCVSKAPKYTAEFFQDSECINVAQKNTLLDSEIYQLRRFCYGQMSVHQVNTALGSLMSVLKKYAYSQALNGADLTAVKPISIESALFSWQALSEVLYQVFVDSGNATLQLQRVRDAQKQLKLTGKKSWQHLCREYCKIALNI